MGPETFLEKWWGRIQGAWWVLTGCAGAVFWENMDPAPPFDGDGRPFENCGE